MLLAAARPNMAKLTPALLNALIFDLMQLMAYFATLTENSKYPIKFLTSVIWLGR